MPLAALRAMGADLEGALEHINVPSYVIDSSGVVRWINAAARNIVGDVQGRQFTSVVAPEDTRRARELFARKIVGNAPVTNAHPELHLTPRQAEVLALLERGRSTGQIADELHLSIETVRNHIRRMLRAVGASSRIEAVAIARGEAF